VYVLMGEEREGDARAAFQEGRRQPIDDEGNSVAVGSRSRLPTATAQGSFASGPIARVRAKVARAASFGRVHERRRAAARKSDLSGTALGPLTIAQVSGSCSSLSPLVLHSGLDLQQKLMEDAIYAFGSQLSPKSEAIAGGNDELGWLTQQMRHIRAEEKVEDFQSQLQQSREIQSIIFQRDSEMLQVRVSKMKKNLPSGLPPTMPPCAPLGKPATAPPMVKPATAPPVLPSPQMLSRPKFDTPKSLTMVATIPIGNETRAVVSPERVWPTGSYQPNLESVHGMQSERLRLLDLEAGALASGSLSRI